MQAAFESTRNFLAIVGLAVIIIGAFYVWSRAKSSLAKAKANAETERSVDESDEVGYEEVGYESFGAWRSPQSKA